MLQSILNTIVNTSALLIFHNTYISDDVNSDLFIHGLENIGLIACIKTYKKFIQDPCKHIQWNF